MILFQCTLNEEVADIEGKNQSTYWKMNTSLNWSPTLKDTCVKSIDLKDVCNCKRILPKEHRANIISKLEVTLFLRCKVGKIVTFVLIQIILFPILSFLCFDTLLGR